jgi:hypothetical protein
LPPEKPSERQTARSNEPKGREKQPRTAGASWKLQNPFTVLRHVMIDNLLLGLAFGNKRFDLALHLQRFGRAMIGQAIVPAARSNEPLLNAHGKQRGQEQNNREHIQLFSY